MSFQAFPFNFPQGPIVVPQTGQLSPGPNGYYFMLSLFNRSGGTDGIVPTVKTGLIAQGASQTTALLLGADWNEVDTVASGTGVQLPNMSPGNDIWVWNNGAHTLSVYPPGGVAFNGSAVNVAKSVASGALAYFQCWQPTLILQALLTASP